MFGAGHPVSFPDPPRPGRANQDGAMNATLEQARVWVTSLATPHEGVQRWHVTAKTPVKHITISISRIKKPGTNYQEFRASPLDGPKKAFRKAQWNRVLAVVVDSLERQVRNEPGVPAPDLPTAGEINEVRRLRDLTVRYKTTPAKALDRLTTFFQMSDQP
jgi:hypothetical protein